MHKYIAGLALGLLSSTAALAWPPPAGYEPGKCKKVAIETGPEGKGRVDYWRCGTDLVACSDPDGDGNATCGPATEQECGRCMLDDELPQQ